MPKLPLELLIDELNESGAEWKFHDGHFSVKYWI